MSAEGGKYTYECLCKSVAYEVIKLMRKCSYAVIVQKKLLILNDVSLSFNLTITNYVYNTYSRYNICISAPVCQLWPPIATARAAACMGERPATAPYSPLTK
jgi:hypothetical protein